MLPLRRLIAIGAAVATCLDVRGDTLDAALALVPKDATGAFVAPSIKKASDDLDGCIERIDRPEALLVGRPIDLLKARLGISIGVRDDGALVGIVRWPADTESPTLTLLVPVTDATTFLDGNFKPDAADGPAGAARRVALASGETLSALAVESNGARWVALSPTPAGVMGIGPDADAAALHRARLLDSAENPSSLRLAEADLLAWIDGGGLRRLGASAAADAAAAGADPVAIERTRRLAEGISIAALAIDIDALGLFARGVLGVPPTSELGGVLARAAEPARPHGAQDGAQEGAPARPSRLSLLPDQPFLWALGIDFDGLGGLAALDALGAVIPRQAAALAPWFAGAREAQFAAYPSKLGVTVGGILNDSALVVRAADPTALRDNVKARLTELDGEHDGVRRTLKWESDKALKESGTADAFELAEVTLPGAAGDATAAIARSVVLGIRGFHGLLRPFQEQGVLVATFSQRPDVWRRAVAAATGGAAGGPAGNGLGANATLTAMRQRGPADPDLEFALGITQILKLAQQVAKAFPGGEQLVPTLDAGTEPIYAAIEASPGRVEGLAIVPSAVVGLVVDQAKGATPPAPR